MSEVVPRPLPPRASRWMTGAAWGISDGRYWRQRRGRAKYYLRMRGHRGYTDMHIYLRVVFMELFSGLHGLTAVFWGSKASSTTIDLHQGFCEDTCRHKMGTYQSYEVDAPPPPPNPLETLRPLRYSRFRSGHAAPGGFALLRAEA